jgi:imidazolonepropionase
MNNYIIKDITQLVTCSGFSAKHGREMSGLGIIENGMVVISDDNRLGLSLHETIS